MNPSTSVISKALARELQTVLEHECTQLSLVMEAQSLERGRQPDSWSRREELGHLIDSAVNNHWRFVRASLEGALTGPGYDQEGWVRAHGYHDLPWPDLISLWRQHNAILVHLIGRVPDARLAAMCRIGDGQPVTLRFLIADYILHMQHHLDHILRRETITAYPGAALGG